MKRGIGVAAVVLLAAACGGDDDGGGGGRDGVLGGGGDGFAAQIAALPLPPDADDGVLTVTFGDLARAAELAGVELPAVRDAGTDEQIDVLNAITGVMFDEDDPGEPVGVLPPEAAHIQELAGIDEFTAEVGWNVFDVQQFVEVPFPPDDVTVLRGDFDEDALTEAMGEPEDGVWVVGTPGELTIEDRSPARPIGEALWLSLDGDRLIVAKTEEGMAVARGGDGPTIGDDEVLTSLAGALDGAGAYSGMLARGEMGGGAMAGGRLTPEQAEAACEGALQTPFAGVAAGITDDDGPVFLFAYATADEDAAAATAAEVEQLVTEGESLITQEPWSERFTFDSAGTDGNVAVVRLRPAEPGPAIIWANIVQQRDSLTSYC